MKSIGTSVWRAPLALLLAVAAAPAARACATCFGASDSAMAQGMNMGILALLLVVGTVLAGIAGFFVYLGWRSARPAGNTHDK